MGHWDYTNIGASAKPKNAAHVEKIFEYIGYAKEPEYSPDGDECSFSTPDVYCCKYSDYEPSSGHIKRAFNKMTDEDLLYLLNALFPKTELYIHSASGNNTNDTWEIHDEVYNPSNMTYFADDKYTSYDDGPRGSKSLKKRFELKPPKAKYVDALIKISTSDGNEELTALLQKLSQKLKDGLITYAKDKTDHRPIGKEYDVINDVDGLDDEMEVSEASEACLAGVCFYVSDFEAIKKELVCWAWENGYDVLVTEDEDILNVFTSLSLAEPRIENESFYMGDETIYCDDLAYPYLEFLNVIGPYARNGYLGYIVCDDGEYDVYYRGELDFEYR